MFARKGTTVEYLIHWTSVLSHDIQHIYQPDTLGLLPPLFCKYV